MKRPTACCIEVKTVAMLNRNGLIAITRVILIASTIPDSSRPGDTIYRIKGSANTIIKIDTTKDKSASKFNSDDDISQADFLFPVANRWLKTGINETAKAPEVKMKNIKSGTVKAAV